MSHKILFATFLSLLGKQVQVGPLLLEVEECLTLSETLMAQIAAANELSVTLRTKIEIQQVVSEVQELISLHLQFSKQLNGYYDPPEDFLDLMLQVIQAQRQPELEEDELEVLVQQFVENENLQKMLRVDVTKLQSEWMKLNLTERLKGCSDKLSDLSARFPEETISEVVVLSTLQLKQEAVGNLIQQGAILQGILTEIGTALRDIPKTLETLVKFQTIALRLKNIWKAYKDYIIKINAVFQTLKNTIERVVDTDTVELVKSGRLFSDESIRTSNEMDVHALQTEWNQLDLIQRAKTCLSELKALETVEDRVHQRAYEL